MHSGRIEGSTRTLGAPKGWDKEKNGPCSGLSIRDVTLSKSGVRVMGSVWFPTPEEIAMIAAGAPIELWIVGESHPPVAVLVGNSPE